MADQKSNFAQTCNLLSQYLKEKRTSYLQVPPTTMNLLTHMETTNPAVDDHITSNTPKPSDIIDMLPQFANNPQAVLADQPAGSAAPMTIFYAGQVLVFNEIQVEKAREILGFATTGGSSKNKICGDHQPNIINVAANISQDVQKVQSQAADIASDLPIARRASLHKFLAKRKERVSAILPYQMNHQRASSPSKSEEEMSSRGQVVEGQSSSKQLELRL